ncbi:MAG: hypothetical protein Fur002_03990 [Anaerolineales bacterium]
MFDDLRQEANSVYEESAAPQAETPAAGAPQKAAQKKRSKLILGMTGPQRFVIAFMMTLMVCVIGFMFLLVMGKIGF